MFGKNALRFLGHRLVRRAKERRQRFEHRRLRAEPAPHAAHFEADHAGPHHAEPLRHFRQRERARVVEHPYIVEGHARQRTRRRASRDDHVRGGELGGLRAVDLDAPASVSASSGERAATVEERDLVLLEQEQDSVVVLRDDLVLARQHLLHIDAKALDLDAVIGERVPGMIEVLG